jgi:hypothetical protein
MGMATRPLWNTMEETQLNGLFGNQLELGHWWFFPTSVGLGPSTNPNPSNPRSLMKSPQVQRMSCRKSPRSSRVPSCFAKQNGCLPKWDTKGGGIRLSWTPTFTTQSHHHDQPLVVRKKINFCWLWWCDFPFTAKNTKGLKWINHE